MKTFNKPYQIWYSSDNGYHLKEYDTLDVLLEDISNLYTNDFYVTKKVTIKIEEII